MSHFLGQRVHVQIRLRCYLFPIFFCPCAKTALCHSTITSYYWIWLVALCNFVNSRPQRKHAWLFRLGRGWHLTAYVPPQSTFIGHEKILEPLPPHPTSLDYFGLYFTNELIDLLVSETNRYADQYMARNDVPPHHPSTCGRPLIVVKCVHSWACPSSCVSCTNPGCPCTGRQTLCTRLAFLVTPWHVTDFYCYFASCTLPTTILWMLMTQIGTDLEKFVPWLTSFVNDWQARLETMFSTILL